MPPAALISILQKGLQYVEAEISINEVSVLNVSMLTMIHWWHYIAVKLANVSERLIWVRA